MNRIKYAIPLAIGTLALAACGGSDSPADPNPEAEPKGMLNLGITDAPVDNAEHVVVQFTGLELVPAGEAEEDDADAGQDNGPPFISIIFDEPKTIDLLALQGFARDFLLDGEELPAGDYDQIRLLVQAEEDGVLDSYIEVDGQQHELFIPSGAQTGLKLNHEFTISPDTTVDYTIDFDLRQSVVFAPGQGYILKPVLRLVETERAGAISGIIDPLVFEGQTCSEIPEEGYAVYLYSGADVSPDDLGSATTPLTTTGVSLDENSRYRYEAAFLEAGEYTIAATCQADQDAPDTDDEIAFAGTANVTVSPGATTTHDIQ